MRQQIRGQWAPPPFNKVLTQPSTPDGLPPGWTGNEVVYTEPSATALDEARAALLGLAAPQKTLVVTPCNEQEAKEIALLEQFSLLGEQQDVLEAKLDQVRAQLEAVLARLG